MSWIEEEMSDCDLGDQRLNERCRVILSNLDEQPRESIPTASKGFADTMAAYRFFDNKRITVKGVLSSHVKSTVKRMSQNKVALLIQDTTELDYSSKSKKIAGLGFLGKEHARGIYVHPLIAVTPERLHLGVVDLQHHRHDEPGKYDKKRDSLPIDEKSSVRWLNGYRKGSEIAKQLPETQVIVIGDRESDIYELFSEAQQFPDGGADWIVRGSHNRRLVGEEAYSIDSLEASTPKGVISFSYNGSQKREARDVYLTIYSQTLSPRAPRRTGQKLPQAEINCILATEENPPEGEEPIRWYLLTSLPVDEPEQIKTVMHYYLCRWEIEVFFRMLKSGCEIEELQLEALSRLLPCIALYMIVSWHILYVMMLGRTVPDLPCNVVFEDIEWHAAYAIAHKKKPPKTPPSLAELILIIAQFGGYLARKNDPPPGPKAMWVGMQKLRNYTVGFQAHAAITPTS